MKLYLSSYQVPAPDELARLVSKSLSEITVAIIPNAKDYYTKIIWENRVMRYVALFSDLGMKTSIVDLRNYSNSDQLLSIISGFDLVWAMGGNTFCLRHAMKRSGFDSAIRRFLERGGVYGGDSAGAIVAGRSLHGVEMGDVPEFAEEVIWDGLNLVSFSIVPHADSASFSEAAKHMFTVQRAMGEVVTLNDNQALIVENETRRLVYS